MSTSVQLGDAACEYPSERLQPLNDQSALYLAKDWEVCVWSTSYCTAPQEVTTSEVHPPRIYDERSARLRLMQGLRAALATDGYLYIKGLIPREAVLAARSKVLAHLEGLTNVLDSRDSSVGVLQENPVIPFMEGKNAITDSPEVSGVISGEHLASFFEGLLGDRPLTFEYKWLRAVGRKGFTGAHCDRVYMSRGSARLHTSWVPFQDTPVELGGLAVCQGSHRLAGFAKLQETYGALDVERDGLLGSGRHRSVL
jgi:hypothetical protein